MAVSEPLLLALSTEEKRERERETLALTLSILSRLSRTQRLFSAASAPFEWALFVVVGGGIRSLSFVFSCFFVGFDLFFFSSSSAAHVEVGRCLTSPESTHTL